MWKLNEIALTFSGNFLLLGGAIDANSRFGRPLKKLLVIIVIWSLSIRISYEIAGLLLMPGRFVEFGLVGHGDFWGIFDMTAAVALSAMIILISAGVLLITAGMRHFTELMPLLASFPHFALFYFELELIFPLFLHILTFWLLNQWFQLEGKRSEVLLSLRKCHFCQEKTYYEFHDGWCIRPTVQILAMFAAIVVQIGTNEQKFLRVETKVRFLLQNDGWSVFCDYFWNWSCEPRDVFGVGFDYYGGMKDFELRELVDESR